MLSVVDEARELKRMREIPDNVNITDMSTNNNIGLVDISFDETLNASDSSNNRKALPHNIRNWQDRNGSLSGEESENEDVDDTINSYNLNGRPKSIGNLNANS